MVSGFKLKEDIAGLFYLESLEPKQIAKQIMEIVEDKQTYVDQNKVVGLYSWMEKAREMDQVYDFAIKNTPAK